MGDKLFEITARFNGGEPVRCDLHIERQVIDVSTATASRPDTDWSFVDVAGHFHAYDHEGNLPTIVRREEYVEWLGGDPDELADDWDDYVEREGYSVIHIECGLCGEKVSPKRIPADPHKVIGGRLDYHLTVYGDVPQDRCSVVVDTPTKVFFGFGHPVSAEVSGGGVPTYQVVCGPMSWRPKAQPPEPEPVDVWAGLRERTEERTR